MFNMASHELNDGIVGSPTPIAQTYNTYGAEGCATPAANKYIHDSSPST
jgi:hypothetical protein